MMMDTLSLMLVVQRLKLRSREFHETAVDIRMCVDRDRMKKYKTIRKALYETLPVAIVGVEVQLQTAIELE